MENGWSNSSLEPSANRNPFEDVAVSTNPLRAQLVWFQALQFFLACESVGVSFDAKKSTSKSGAAWPVPAQESATGREAPAGLMVTVSACASDLSPGESSGLFQKSNVWSVAASFH